MYTTPTKKETIVETMAEMFLKVNKEFEANPRDPYVQGKYSALLQLMSAVKIYEKGE